MKMMSLPEEPLQLRTRSCKFPGRDFTAKVVKFGMEKIVDVRKEITDLMYNKYLCFICLLVLTI
jgi:hypothetical protein